MEFVQEIIILIISSLFLVKSADTIVKSLDKISRFLKISQFSVSFILMALATSLPEVFVAVEASIANEGALSLGNVIGSNIVDMTLVLGVAILLAGCIRVRSVIAKRDALYMLILTVVPLVFLIDKNLSRVEGFILLIFYLFYLFRLFKQKSAFKKELPPISKKDGAKSFFFFVLGITLLLISSKLLVDSGIKLGLLLNIPSVLVGLFLISIGTSLPELAFETQAIVKNESELALGDLIGSVVTNSTLVLATTALISPINIENWAIFGSSAFFVVFILISFNLFIRTDRKLDTIEGLLLIFIYLVFLFLEFGVEIITH